MSPKLGRLEQFVDQRGEIRDLLREVKLDSVTLIRTLKGAVRGNHYHQQTTQWIYVISGRLRVVTQNPEEPPEEAVYVAGDLFFDPPGQRHAWHAWETTLVLVFTQGPRSGDKYESDVIRLPENERLI